MPLGPSTEPSADNALATIDARARSLLEGYVEALLTSAQLFNLTAIVEREQVWERHVNESLRLVPLLGTGTNLIDVGSGGGLPGMVLAIARPELMVTLLEATAKKARFIQQTAAALGLTNVEVLAERAEVVGSVGARQRERFDIVTARAVAPLRVLVELTAPLAKVAGRIVCVKGEKAASEVEQAEAALRLLHLEHEQTVRQPTASVVLLRKIAPTPKTYPRRSGEPKRKPL